MTYRFALPLAAAAGLVATSAAAVPITVEFTAEVAEASAGFSGVETISGAITFDDDFSAGAPTTNADGVPGVAFTGVPYGGFVDIGDGVSTTPVASGFESAIFFEDDEPISGLEGTLGLPDGTYDIVEIQGLAFEDAGIQDLGFGDEQTFIETEWSVFFVGASDWFVGDPLTEGLPAEDYFLVVANLSQTVFGDVSDAEINESALGVATLVDGPAPVPLPAAGWMLIAGVGAIGAARARRR